MYQEKCNLFSQILFVICDIKATKFSYNLVWVAFQTNGLSICHLILMAQQRLIRGLHQCTVCLVLKLDTITLVTVTFERLGRYQKTKISMKAD